MLLAAAFIANESLKKHYTRVAFQISLFYLSLFSFLIFIVPVLVHQIGPAIFILSGLWSVLGLWLFLVCLHFFARETFKQSKRLVIISVGTIFIIINILYFLNVIPPLPLALADGGIYHSLSHTPDGYVVTAEPQTWWNSFFNSQTVHVVPGDRLYAHTAIFSPAQLDTTIFHEWQKYDSAKGWLTVSRLNLTIIGGRAEGYNTYSIQGNITPGQWRVNVTTASGQIIGRLRFTVVGVAAEPALVTEIK